MPKTKKSNEKTWKRPRKVNIGALTYKIRYVTPGKGKELLKGESGCISQERQLIEIDRNITDQLSFLILIHEILHGIGEAMCPNRSPFAKELFTCTVAELLTQALLSTNLLPNVLNGLSRGGRGKRKGRN